VGVVVLGAHVALQEAVVHAAVVDAPHPHHVQLALRVVLASPGLLFRRQKPLVQVVLFAVRLVVAPRADPPSRSTPHTHARTHTCTHARTQTLTHAPTYAHREQG
jgi:hypothetical protein